MSRGSTDRPRPYGRDVIMTSRLHRAGGRRNPWLAEPGVEVDLPVTLDFIIQDRVTGEVYSTTQATVDLHDGEPVLVRVLVESPAGLDIIWTQREFRWAGPLEVVTRLVPALIRAGQDPFKAEFPVSDFPYVTEPVPQRRLSDEFLEDVARQYLQAGRGYAKALSVTYNVSPRTVVSWVEKARKRGILGPTQPGRSGGSIQPRRRRPS